MKIRTGFVTNSSSSSFVVVFDKIPASVEELKELLFGDKKDYYEGITTQQAADDVWGDLTSAPPNDREDIAEVFSHYWGEDSPNIDDFRKADGIVDWKAIRAVRLEHGKKLANEFLEKHQGKFAYSFVYTDDAGDPVEGALRNGGVFDRIVHERIM